MFSQYESISIMLDTTIQYYVEYVSLRLANYALVLELYNMLSSVLLRLDNRQ